MHRFRTWLSDPLRLFLTLCALLPIILVLIFLNTYRLRVPFDDEWRLNAYVAIDTVDGKLDPSDLLFLYGGHRAVFTNVVAILSALIDHWNLRAESLVSIVLALVALGLLFALFRRSVPGGVLVALVPFSALVFTLAREKNWYITRHSHWFFANVFILAAVWVVQRTTLTWRSLIISTVFGICATFSMATGMLVWPLVLLQLWLQGERRWRYFMVWIVLALITSGLYISNSGTLPGTVADPQNYRMVIVPPLDQFIQFVTSYVGYAIFYHSDFDYTPAYLALAGGILFGFNLLYLAWRDHSLHVPAPWLAIGLYSWGAAAMTALGRLVDDGVTRAFTPQYAAAGSLFWIALVALMIIVLRGRSESRRHWLHGHILVPLNVVLAVVMIALYAYRTYDVVQEFNERWDQSLTLDAPTQPNRQEQCVLDFIYTRDADCLGLLGMRIPNELRAIDELAARRLALFSTVATTSIVPSSYRSESLIVVASSNAWLNVHIRDFLLNRVSESQVFHITPDNHNLIATSTLPNPLDPVVSDQLDNDLERFNAGLANGNEVWIVRTPDAPDAILIAIENLIEQGYTAIYEATVDQPLQLVVTGYQRLDLTPELTYVMGGNIGFYGWKLDNSVAVEPCQSITLRSFWATDEPIRGDYAQTVVIATVEGIGIARNDGPPAGLTVRRWEVDQLYLDRRAVQVPCDAPPGDYVLLTGIYDPETLASLPVVDTNGNPASGLLYLTTLHVE